MARKIKGFSRVDSGDAHGWLVRIKRGDVRRSRFISDSTYGGKKKSQAEAKKVYEAWVAELPEPDTAEDKLGKRNSSGVVGVHYSYDVDARYPGCAYEYYIASWKTDDGRRQNVRFAISKWGKQKAFELACVARELRSNDRKKIEAAHAKRAKSGKLPKATGGAAPKKKAAAKKAAPKKKAAKKAAPKKKAAKKAAPKKKVAKKAAKKPAKKKTAKKKKR